MKTISVEDAVALIPNGASLMIGGFMGVGTPERLVVAKQELEQHASFARYLVHRLEEEATPALLKRNARCVERARQRSFDL